MIQVIDYHKTYRDLTAVAGLTFEVRAGSILGLVGPNGAGKTTTLRALAGIIPPTRGRLIVAGHDVAAEPVAAKRELAYVPDDPKLFDSLTVWEHFEFIASAYGVVEFGPKAEQFLQVFELTEKRDTIAQELSRGMRQKVAVACAYLHDPRVILFDEPLTGLDPHGIRTLKASIHDRAAAGAAIIVSSHLLSLVEDLCSDLLILQRGRALFCGPVGEARTRFGSLGQDASLEEVFFRAIEGQQPEQALAQAIRGFHTSDEHSRMNRTLWLLTKLRARAAVRKALRTLRRPRGALLSLFALGFFALILLPNLLVSRAQVPEVNMTRFLDPKILFGLWLLLTASGQNFAAIAFRLSEVGFLFPGPFSRRELLIYKLLGSVVGPLGTSMLLPIFLWRFSFWMPALMLGVWLAYVFMQTTSLLCALVASWLNERFLRWRSQLAVALAAVLAIWIWQSGALAAGLDISDRLAALESTWLAQAVLAPFAAFCNLARATDSRELALWGAASLAANGVVFALVLWMDANFLEASLRASERRYEFLQRAKRGGGIPAIGVASKPRLTLPRFPRLGGAGPVAWRQALELMRSSARLIFVLPAIIAMAAPAFLGQKRSLAGAIFAVTAFIGFMISTIIPMGLRTDLQHVDALKSLPVSSGAIVWGSMASAVLYPTLLQIAIVVVLSAVGGEWSWASTAAVCFALPINLLLTSGDSVLVLLYPSTRRFAPGDFLAGMRLTLSYVIKMLFVMLALGVAGLGMALVYLVLGESPLATFVMATLGWLILMIEGAATVGIAAWLFARFDPSLEAAEDS